MEVKAESSAPASSSGPSRRSASAPSPPDPLKVIVSGYPPYSHPQDIARVFSKFGSLVVNKLTPKYATLVFSKKGEAAEAVKASKKINVYGEFLTVKPYTEKKAAELAKASPKRNFSKTKEKGKVIEPSEIDLSGGFCEQLQKLLAAVRLTQEEVEALGALYLDVQEALQPQWPGCRAVPFGSITTGLGVKWSDADCLVLAPPRPAPVHRAKRLLDAHPEVFTEILTIPRANTPIVKFFHIPTGTHCDLSFKTALGAQNSKLVAFLLHLDARLLPAAVLAKYWARVHQLSGTGRLSNYALTMLLVFYLQRLRLLPAVHALQQNRDNDVIVDFWNTGFTPEDDRESPPDDRSILELVGGFFKFYSEFDYEDLVVCPYLGVPVKKEAFRDPNLLPKEFERYERNVSEGVAPPLRCDTAVCVQDPFEQCHNVASAISSRMLADLKAYFKHAADAFAAAQPAGGAEFLPAILLTRPNIVRERVRPDFRVCVSSRVVAMIDEPDWKAVARDVAFAIFEDMLKIKLARVEEEPNPKTGKARERERYAGAITRAIWKRKQFTRLYNYMNLDFREKQARITEEILKTDREVLDVQFTLTLTFARSENVIAVVKLATGDEAAFREFGKFFVSVMQGWFAALVRPPAGAGPPPAGAGPPPAGAGRPAAARELDATLDALELDSEEEEATALPLVVTNSAIRVGPVP